MHKPQSPTTLVAPTPSPTGIVVRLIRLAAPVTVGQLAIVGMGVTDIIIAGRHGTNDLAGISLGSSIFNLSIMFMIGIVLGNGPIVGQLQGAGDFSILRKQFQSCLWLCLPMGLLCAGFVGLGIVVLPGLDATDTVINIASDYLLPMIGSALLLPFILAYRTTFESMGYAKPAMVFNLLGFLINIPLDYALVTGQAGLPSLGGAGCGWATLIVSTGIVLGESLYARYAGPMLSYRLYTSFGWPTRERLRETLRVGLPIGGAILAEGGFFLIIPLFIAPLGAVVVSGHAIAISFDWVMFMVPMGISQAIAVLTAHELGGNNPHLARHISFAGLRLTAAIALVQASLVVIFRRHLAELFSPDPAVQDLAALLLVYAATFRVFDAINVGGNGALRGYKDTRITLVLAFSGYWLIGFPLSYSLALTHWLGPPLGVEGFWVGMVIALIITSVATTWRVRKTTLRSLTGTFTTH